MVTKSERQKARQEQEAQAIRGEGRTTHTRIGEAGHCIIFAPANREGEQVNTDAIGFLEDSYSGKVSPEPKPAASTKPARTNWLLAEHGVEDDGEAKSSLFVPRIRLKRGWIPEKMYGLTKAAYDIAGTAGRNIPANYGVILLTTRLAPGEGLFRRPEDGLEHQLDFMVCFNFTSAGLHIASTHLELQSGAATLCAANDSIGVDPSSRPQYVVIAHFVRKHVKVFRWENEDEWRQAHPYSRSRSRGES